MALGTKEAGEEEKMNSRTYKEMYTRLNEYKSALYKCDKLKLELQEEKDKIYKPRFTLFDAKEVLDLYKLRAYTPREVEEIKSRINEIAKRLNALTIDANNCYWHTLEFIHKLRNEEYEDILRRVHLVRVFDYENAEYNAETMLKLYHSALDRLVCILEREGEKYGR